MSSRLPVPPAIIEGADVTSMVDGPVSSAAAITDLRSGSGAPAIQASS
ncbi:MAG: hypothetical protein QM754_20830 [Tepidisphaeraceae bacterium]